ncbi:hypothetical protein BST97_05650 [Nonlabens spongiae]|uniref:Uncharacterized protein n=1 Tax=Nonlabens spongiae TaxID=331648 RepID=A0A1W6MIR8_9FLAO|nr:hypothetical protein [Nonlabens spongiae]ARN77508.1 hypothetical protein BST97_05650 [Nonlabens spongiae]
MKTEPIYSEITISADDRKKITRGMIGIVAVPVMFGIFIYFIFSWVVGRTVLTGEWEMFDYMILFFMGLIISVCTYLLIRKAADLRTGVKHVYEGILEDKRKDIQKTTTSSGGAGRRSGGGTRTKATITYYLKIAGKEFAVSHSKYAQVATGDLVKLEIAPKSKLILNLQTVQKATEAQPDVDVDSLRSSIPDKVIKTNLTPQDEEVLRKIWLKKLRTKLLFIAVPLLIAFSFIVQGWWGLLLLFFPVPIIIVWNAISLLRWYLKYQSIKRDHVKEEITTTVTDKTTTSGNRTATSYLVSTQAGAFSIDKSAYDEVKSGDRIVIEKTPVLNLVLGTRVG